MSCKKCKGPTGHRKDSPFGIVIPPKFEYSETAKAIEKIKNGIKYPKFEDVCTIPILPNDNNLILAPCKDNPELAFYTGFEMAVLQCGELLAKAQDNDK